MHLNGTFNYANKIKNNKIYSCNLCDYTCSDLSNFKKHLQTKKHKNEKRRIKGYRK